MLFHAQLELECLRGGLCIFLGQFIIQRDEYKWTSGMRNNLDLHNVLLGPFTFRLTKKEIKMALINKKRSSMSFNVLQSLVLYEIGNLDSCWCVSDSLN